MRELYFLVVNRGRPFWTFLEQGTSSFNSDYVVWVSSCTSIIVTIILKSCPATEPLVKKQCYPVTDQILSSNPGAILLMSKK